MNLQHWEQKPWITIDFRKDFGEDMLVATEGKPKFRLRPKRLTNGLGQRVIVAFSVDFDEGQLPDNWGSIHLMPRGNQPPPALSRKLPPYAEEHKALYADVLDPLVTQLYGKDTNIERLDGRIPLFLCRCEDSKRQLTVDRVRMVYLQDVVDGPDPDLVVVVFSWADGFKVMQNGVGTGPPRNVGP